jgi:hypothetical protein
MVSDPRHAVADSPRLVLGMTREQWLLTILSLSWSGWMISFVVGKWVQRREGSADVPLWRITQLERRMDQAGDKMSDLANAIQGMPERLRDEFVTRREWDAIEKRSK